MRLQRCSLQLEALEDRLPPGDLRGGMGEFAEKHEYQDALVNDAAIAAAQSGRQNAAVLPIGSSPYGKTYGEWSVAWWQWTLSLPVDHHPLFDTAGVSAGQSGHVWFLGGTFTTTEGDEGEVIGEAERTVSVPAGTALFFPIVNSEWSRLEGNGNETAAELRATATDQADAIVPESLFVQVDGKSLKHLESFRPESQVFTMGPLPDNNIFAHFGYDAPAGTTSLSAVDGYYAMLAPLSVGTHTLHFGGTQEAPGFKFVQDITYHITVTPGH